MVLNIIEIVLAVLLITGILLQARGSGLGAASAKRSLHARNKPHKNQNAQARA